MTLLALCLAFYSFPFNNKMTHYALLLWRNVRRFRNLLPVAEQASRKLSFYFEERGKGGQLLA
ncbi:MAG: hypothetical protein M3R15_33950, partial [Acidobacteriota bacterium]|nr:hypothetical protein [Acidobacteriota bacterium]